MARKAKRAGSKPKPRSIRRALSKARLRELMEEALVDAYGEDEQRTSFFYALEQHLALPFETEVLGVPVMVEKIDLAVSGEIVAICRRGKRVQRIAIIDLPLPRPEPAGAEWIAAYRSWARGS